MRDFNFKAEYQKLLTPEVVAYLTQIHEYKGQQNLFIEAKADALSNLLEVAKIQSTEASNRIEGIITTDDRLKKIVREKTIQNRLKQQKHNTHPFLVLSHVILSPITAAISKASEYLIVPRANLFEIFCTVVRSSGVLC